jgi:hypothetical protein
MEDETPPPKMVRFKADGTPDGRGHAEGSRATRFGKGDGRRRPGRPKGAISLRSAYEKAAALPVYSADRRQKWSTADAIAMRQREKALKGDEKATKRFEDRIASYFPEAVDTANMNDLLAEDLAILRRGEARGAIPPRPSAPPSAPGQEEDAATSKDKER